MDFVLSLSAYIIYFILGIRIPKLIPYIILRNILDFPRKFQTLEKVSFNNLQPAMNNFKQGLTDQILT